MSSVLPKSIDYRQLPNSLSNNISSSTQILNPVNSKSTFTANDIINFDFNIGNRAFIDPKSIYISYKADTTTGAGATGGMIFGVLVYSPFLRVDTLINGQTIESVNQYSQVCYIYVNTNTDIAGKAGVQYSYGYNGTEDSTLMSSWDGRTISANTADESIAM